MGVKNALQSMVVVLPPRVSACTNFLFCVKSFNNLDTSILNKLPLKISFKLRVKGHLKAADNVTYMEVVNYYIYKFYPQGL